MTEYNQFLALCQQVEAAKHSDDPTDRMWLQWHQDMAQAHGLHPDAIAASPVYF